MGNSNRRLNVARDLKADEFYTQYQDIENEVSHYAPYLSGKCVYCNCDNPEWSNFFKYFRENFDALGLRKLIASFYIDQSPREDLFNDSVVDRPFYVTVNGKEMKRYSLKGDGDFRSRECIELLRECDVVITNPPFSLLREFVKTVMKYGKKLLIVGNQNTIVRNDLMPFIMNDELWFGYGFKGGAAHFINMHYDDYASSGNHQSGMIRVSGVVWFTNMDTKKRHVPMELTRTYSPEKYPKYDDESAINVDFVDDIPKDYYGPMGVPVTFMSRYCPEQFSILGLVNGSRGGHIGEREVYKRLLIKRK